MARQKGSANFAGTLEVLAGGPLDARTRVPAKADLTASGQFPYPYVGLECYVIAENKKYRLIADDPTVLANWEEVGSSGTGLPSGGTQGQVLTKQSSTEGDADWDDIPHDNTKANSASIAPVETSTTSEHAYTVGNHLMLAGQRYIVTSDIAIGDTLDISTNIQAVSIEDETGLSQADFAEIITPLPGKFMGGLNYSLEEQVIGTWIDGSTLYQKTINFGALPNNTAKYVDHGITDLDIITGLFAITNNGTRSLSIPHVSSTESEVIQIYQDQTNNSKIGIKTGSDRTSFVTTYITIQYTKTT